MKMRRYSSTIVSAHEKAQEDERKKDEQKEKEEKAGTANDRLFWALPNFLTVENGKQVPPLTTRQKYHEAIRESFDLVDYAWYGFLAGLSQANHGDPGYGQGARGYAKRYGSEFADGTIENLFTAAVFPAMLREGSSLLPAGHGRSMAPGRLFRQPVVRHPDGCGRTAVQLLGNCRQRRGRPAVQCLPLSRRPGRGAHDERLVVPGRV
jgi:hypothetical protein